MQQGERTIAILDAADGHLVSRVGTHGDTIVALTYSADGSLIASGSNDHTVKLWDAASGAERATLVTYDAGAPAPGAASVAIGRLWVSQPAVEADISARLPGGSEQPLSDTLKTPQASTN